MTLPEAVLHSIDRIAVIGMACRFPGAENYSEFWKCISAGKVSVRHFDQQTLLNAGVPEANVLHENFVPAKGVLADTGAFDHEFFGISPREASLIDPQHRIFLEQLHTALEDAGYGHRNGAERIGVFGGAAFPTFLPWLLQRAPELGSGDAQLSAMLGSGADYMTMRGAFKLDLRGPALTVQTACSSSLVAVHLAIQALLAGDCDIAVAGGATVRSPQIGGHIYREGGALARTGECRPFDAEATGLVNGCGVGLVVLRRLEDALAEGDTVRAVILGSAINNDGAQKQAFSAPNPAAQEQVVGDALAVAGLAGAEIDYVEAHGTGTKIGDAIEAAALNAALSPRSQPCFIGSVKANIGHLDAAAGVAGLIKAILAMENRLIPPQPHFSVPNPGCRFEKLSLQVSPHPQPWPRTGSIPRAGVSSFGFGGTNAHVVLEGVEQHESPPDGDSSSELFIVQARSPERLQVLADRLADWLLVRPDLALADVAATLRMGRAALPCRGAFVAASRAEAIDALRNLSIGGSIAGDRLCLLDLSNLGDPEDVLLSLRQDQEAEQIVHFWTEQVAAWAGTDGDDGNQSVQELRLQRLIAVLSLGQVLKSRGLFFDGVRTDADLYAAGQFLVGRIGAEAAILQTAAVAAKLDEPAACVAVREGLAGLSAIDTTADLAERIADAIIVKASEPPPPGSPHAWVQHLIGLAWAQGAKCDWRTFQADRPLRRVPLPGYPFARTPLPDAVAAFSHDGSAQSPKTSPSGEPRGHLWLADWKIDKQPISYRPRHPILLIHEDTGFAKPLANALGRFGKTAVVSVKDFEAYDLGAVAPDTQAIYLCCQPEEGQAASAAGQTLAQGHRIALRLASIVARFDCVGIGAFQVIGGDCAGAGAAALHALLNTIRLERRVANGRIVDADPWAIARGAVVEAARLTAAALMDDGPDEICVIRGRSRFRRSFQRASAPVEQRYIRSGGTYVLIGGTGGLGVELSKTLAILPDVKLAIMSRSAGMLNHAELASKIGINPERLLVIALDVAEASSVGRALSDVMREFGSLDGIFHLAGDAGAGLHQGLGKTELSASFDAKAKGVEALLQALPIIDVDDSPRFLAVISSLSGTFGYPGQSLYAAANAAAEAIAAQAPSVDVRVVSIALDQIHAIGMADAARGAQLAVDMRPHSWIAREHRSHGQGYLPGSAALGLMVQACSQLAPSMTIALEQVNLLRPLPLADSGEERLWLRIKQQPDQPDQIELFSDIDDGARPFARCTIVPGVTSPDLGWLDLADLTQRCNLPVDLVQEFDGVELGERWRAPLAVWAGKDEWRIEASLAEVAGQDCFPSPIHPALLDLALSAALSAAGRTGYVPSTYGRVVVAPSLFERSGQPVQMFSHVKVTTRSESSIRFDVSIADSSGQVLLQVNDYLLVAATLGRNGPETGRGPYRLPELDAPLAGGEATQAIYDAIESDLAGHFWVSNGDLQRASTAVAAAQAGPAAHSVPNGDGPISRIAGAMAEVLGVSELQPDDDFFALGGDSILALELVGALNDSGVLRAPLSPQDLYQAPTARQLADFTGSDRPVAEQSSAVSQEPDPTDDEVADAIARFNLANAAQQ